MFSPLAGDGWVWNDYNYSRSMEAAGRMYVWRLERLFVRVGRMKKTTWIVDQSVTLSKNVNRTGFRLSGLMTEDECQCSNQDFHWQEVLTPVWSSRGRK